MFWLLVAAIWTIKVGFHKTHAASTMLAQGKLLHKKISSHSSSNNVCRLEHQGYFLTTDLETCQKLSSPLK